MLFAGIEEIGTERQETAIIHKGQCGNPCPPDSCSLLNDNRLTKRELRRCGPSAGYLGCRERRWAMAKGNIIRLTVQESRHYFVRVSNIAAVGTGQPYESEEAAHCFKLQVPRVSSAMKDGSRLERIRSSAVKATGETWSVNRNGLLIDEVRE